ncbi:MAG: alpha-amylase [Ignavibacteria bacterium]|nr:alpha-amylase [Ignavibacteria bacterium]
MQLNKNGSITYFLHVSADSRVKYNIPLNFFSITGNIIVADFHAARQLSEIINAERRKEGSDTFVTPGLINAAALFHEVLHYVISKYEQEINPGVLQRALENFTAGAGFASHELLLQFVTLFPPKPVITGRMTAKEYLSGYTGTKSNTVIIYEELLLLYLENINPAITPLKDLFDDTMLKKMPVYEQFINHSNRFFEDEKPIGITGFSLLRFLQMPIDAHPDNADLQLKYMLERWGISIYDGLKLKLLGGADLIYEDSKLFQQHGGKGDGGPIPEYKLLSIEEIRRLKSLKEQGIVISGSENPDLAFYLEEEQFTPDTAWMPKVVMLAKNIFVWLDQLSKKHGRSITTLDQIPDSELDQLRSWHFNALWLIGVWERSSASKKVKQFCGNHDAVASAYSLFDYNVAEKLGGYEALKNLKERCWQRGIRLASDMVPNHTGIFSKWLLDNPNYFIQADNPPYPSYSFTGPDLSDDPAYQIRIEDRYYTKQDAAVVFELYEKNTGRVRYIYHGNDGTNMPWNDTAQLNLLLPEVREALIKQIQHVASLFPIIRFDAAMTLTKKHFQRLWFPQPGLGGAIPSRSDYSMTFETFDSHMPIEFWREVVDRMNSEMPDTLLLAEAFWLMEGYFVRTLGMHRVYNSAFMHMFMREENYKYKELIRNTLEFNPEILKRYVNFMSNPDEETAVNQFGKGDKYFGVSVMMITLPGLPMFAHGQVEGFTEKYGMEYQRAYYNELPDYYLIDRHERELVPLVQRRWLFSEVHNFWLYDFMISGYDVNHNVIAFTNQSHQECGLVLYNNSYEQTFGRVMTSCRRVKGDAQSQESPDFYTTNLADALHLNNSPSVYYSCYETRSRNEYLFSGSQIATHGFETNLNGYEYKVFINFKEIIDTNGDYEKLYQVLQGKGVPSIQEALNEVRSYQLHAHLNELFNRTNINEFLTFSGYSDGIGSHEFSPSLISRLSAVVDQMKSLGYDCELMQKIVQLIQFDLTVLRFCREHMQQGITKANPLKTDFDKFTAFFYHDDAPVYNDMLIIFLVMRRILSAVRLPNGENYSDLINKFVLPKQLWQALIRLNNNYQTIKDEFDLLLVLIAEVILPEKTYQIPIPDDQQLTSDQKMNLYVDYSVKLLEIPEIRYFIGYNVYDGIEYFSRERYDVLLRWNFFLTFFDWSFQALSAVSHEAASIETRKKVLKSRIFASNVANLITSTNMFETLSGRSGYRLQDYLKSIVLESKNSSANSVSEKKEMKKRLVSKKPATGNPEKQKMVKKGEVSTSKKLKNIKSTEKKISIKKNEKNKKSE